MTTDRERQLAAQRAGLRRSLRVDRTLDEMQRELNYKLAKAKLAKLTKK